MFLYTAGLITVWIILVDNVLGQLDPACPAVNLSCSWNCILPDTPVINCEKPLGQQVNASEKHCAGYRVERDGRFALLVKEIKLNGRDSCAFSEYATFEYYHDSLLLLPESLNAFEGLKRLVLRIRFGFEIIDTGVFSARLASLENLQLDTPGVSEIEPGAFKELKELRRLFISNLKVTRLTNTILQGLSQLRVLELPDNALTTLDSTSFAASPRLEYIDLRTRTVISVTIAPDAFCILTVLQQLQYRGSIGINCSNFLSPRVHLMISEGSDTRNVICIGNSSNASVCNAAKDNPSTHRPDKLYLSTHSTLAGREQKTELIDSTTESMPPSVLVTDATLTIAFPTSMHTTRKMITLASTSSINAPTTTYNILTTVRKLTIKTDTAELMKSTTPVSSKPNTTNRKASTTLSKPTVVTAETLTVESASPQAEVTAAPMTMSPTVSTVKPSTVSTMLPSTESTKLSSTVSTVIQSTKSAETTPASVTTSGFASNANVGVGTIAVMAATVGSILLVGTVVLIIVVVIRRRRDGIRRGGGFSMRSSFLLPIAVDSVVLDDSL